MRSNDGEKAPRHQRGLRWKFKAESFVRTGKRASHLD